MAVLKTFLVCFLSSTNICLRTPKIKNTNTGQVNNQDEYYIYEVINRKTYLLAVGLFANITDNTLDPK